MTKFKVGDRVRASTRREHGCTSLTAIRYKGEFEIVKLVDWPGEPFPLATFANGLQANCHWLELVPPSPALITMDGKYTTRDGRAVRIFALDGGGDYPVLGASARDEDGTFEPACWTADGRFLFDSPHESDYDLIPAVEKPREYEAWINMYPDGAIGYGDDAYTYRTRAEADSAASSVRVACVHVKYVAGEGLTDGQ